MVSEMTSCVSRGTINCFKFCYPLVSQTLMISVNLHQNHFGNVRLHLYSAKALLKHY